MSNNITASQEVDDANASVAAFLTSIVINLCVCVAATTTFALVRRRYPWCFRPRVEVPDKQRRAPPDIETGGRWRWIYVLFHLTEDELLEMVGLDAAMFLRFFQLGLRYFSVVSLATLVFLLPVYLTDSNDDKRVDTFELGQMSTANVSKESDRFWATILMVYSCSIYLLYLLYREFVAYSSLRHRYYLIAHADDKVNVTRSKTVLIQDLPRDLMTDEALETYFRKLYPDQFKCSVLTRDVSKVEALCAKRDAAVASLEHTVAVWIWAERDPEKRPKKGKKDAIEELTKTIAELNESITAEQKELGPAFPSAFVTFKTYDGAATAAQMCQSPKPFLFTVCPAPAPGDVFWVNLKLGYKERLIRSSLVTAATFFLISFFMIPVTAVSVLTNLETLEQEAPWLKDLLEASPVIRGFLAGFLPSLALLVFMLLLPPILLQFAKIEGRVANSWLVEGVFERFFLFQLIVFFLGSVVAAGLMSEVQRFADDPGSIIETLAVSIPEQATTFLIFVMLQALATFPISLLRLGPLILGTLKARFLVKTPAELVLARTPRPFEYGAAYPMHLLVFMIGVVYAPIAPFLLVFVVAFFLIGTVVFRYLFCFVFKPTYESGGSLFPKVFTRIIVAMLLGHLTMIGQLALKIAPTQSALLVPLPIVTFIFYVLVMKTMGSSAQRLSREEIVELDAADTDTAEDVEAIGDGGGVLEEEKDTMVDEVSYVHPRLREKSVSVEAVIAKLEREFPQLRVDLNRKLDKVTVRDAGSLAKKTDEGVTGEGVTDEGRLSSGGGPQIDLV